MSHRTLGFAILHSMNAWRDPRAHSAALTLLTSPSWPIPPRYFMSVATPGQRLSRRPGMIPAKRFLDEVGQALRNPDIASLSLYSSREMTDEFRGVTLEREWLPGGGLVLTHGGRPAEGDGAEAWVSDAVNYGDQVGSCAGVVVVMADHDEVTSECSRVLVGRRGGIAHPCPDQAERMRGANERYMGLRYMRFPRWGTLVGHEHVAQLGGLEAIERAVQPVVVRPLSGGVYFQLTASITTAMGDEAMAKQRAFTDLAAPLLPPTVAPRG